jgi:hypothetical protein
VIPAALHAPGHTDRNFVLRNGPPRGEVTTRASGSARLGVRAGAEGVQGSPGRVMVRTPASVFVGPKIVDPSASSMACSSTLTVPCSRSGGLNGTLKEWPE